MLSHFVLLLPTSADIGSVSSNHTSLQNLAKAMLLHGLSGGNLASGIAIPSSACFEVLRRL